MFNMNAGFKGTVAENYNTQNKQIRKLAEFVGESFRIWGFIITKEGNFGRGVLLCADSCMVSLPKRYLEKFQSFTDYDIEQLKSGNVYVYKIETRKASKAGQKDTVAFEMEEYAEYKKWLDSQNKTL